MLRTARSEVDLEVAVHDPAATVADLAGAFRRRGFCGPLPADGTVLLIDGVTVVGATPLTTRLRPGSEVAIVPPAEASTAPPQDHEVELAVIGGLAAGGRHPLRRGCSIVGRHPAGAAVLPGRTTSSRHARLDVQPGLVTVGDAGSTSGTWVDGRRIHGVEPVAPGAVLALGAALLRLSVPGWTEPALLGPRRADGRRPLHRPPPVPPPPGTAALTPPSPEAPPADGPRFAWATALVPLAAGLGLAWLVDPRLALFTLLGPAVLLGQWVEDRRRHRRRGSAATAGSRAGLVAFAADVQVAATAEAERRTANNPDPAALGREICALGAQLWSRRPGGPAFREVTVGLAAAAAWTPPTTTPPAGGAAAVLTTSRLPHGCPLTVSLSPGSHLGIAGERSAALAAARWVVLQLAAHHGPADLRIALVCAADRAAEWHWAAFLPHTVPESGSGRRLLASGPEQAAALAELWADSTAGSSLVVVDGDGLVDGGGPAAALAVGATVTIAPGRRSLPGRCTAVLDLDGSDGWAELASGAGPFSTALATGIERSTARSWARRLAALADPEAVEALPTPAAARLVDLLALEGPTAEELRRRWDAHLGAVTPLGTAVGAHEVEAVTVDLVADGPHMLVAGTTGAGKSEMLRTLVAGLAASSPPDRLTLLLIDYKGGAAFAQLAALPHVVGVVTDLAAEDAARALRSLEAELRRREAVLAAMGVRDLVDHPAHRPHPPAGIEPLPRLVVVVDELAALVAEQPAFLDGLVQLSARGRSLGLHLVLATQRPGSVVSAAVRTNCAIRCCLRVPDEADAIDVVGSASPARLDRRQPGRAFLRRGAGDLVELQVALVGGRGPAAPAPVTVEPATFGPAAAQAVPVDRDGPNDLALLVAACREVAAGSGHAGASPLWLPPLPPVLPATALPAADPDVVIGLVDDPDHQRRLPLRWRPGGGPLLAVGSGAGPALALHAAARALAAAHRPGALHVYGLDLGAQNLAGLAGLDHVGAIVRAGEQERVHRLLQRLADALAARQAAASAGASLPAAAPPLLLVLIDGVGALRAALDGGAGLAALDALERVVVDGAALGLAVALTADRMAAVPAAWAGAASCRLAFRGGDPLDLLAAGGPRLDQTRWPDGRCVDLGCNLVAQVATGGWPDPATGSGGGPDPVTTLPRAIPLPALLAAGAPQAAVDGLRLPIGIDGRRLDIATARLRPGHPFLVCGPPGSGRTTAIATIAAAVEAAGCTTTGPEGLAPHIAGRGAGTGLPPLVVIVDDADRVPDPDGHLAALASGRHAGGILVAAAPPEAVRSGFGHWSAELRRARSGIVLRPRSELDGDVLGVGLLPRWPVPLSHAGRGVLVVDGEPVPVQLATP